MKQTFAWSLIALACGAAHAQVPDEGVQMYGLVDVGIHHVSGLLGGSKTMLSSGLMEGSRLGFKGSENLGDGYKTFFVLESRLEADNGTLSNRPPSGTQLPDRLTNATLLGLPSALQAAVTGVAATLGNSVGVNTNGAFFDRQAFLGIVTPVGAILGGRQYTPAYEVAAGFDTTGTQSALAAGQLASLPAGFDIRVSNALAYRVALHGFSAALMYGFGESSSGTSASRLYGLNAKYTGNGYSLGLGYNTRNNELGEKSLTAAVVGGTLDAGPGTAHLMVASFKDDHPTGLSTIAPALVAQGASATVAVLVQGAYSEALKQEARLYHVGYRMPIGAHTLYVTYSKLDDRRASNADSTSYGVGYSHALSKRTDISAVVARYVNTGLGQAGPGGNGFLGGVTASAGTDANSLALGLRHRF